MPPLVLYFFDSYFHGVFEFLNVGSGGGPDRWIVYGVALDGWFGCRCCSVLLLMR